MKTQIETLDVARKEFASATSNEKEMLTRIFGNKILPVMERIKTMQDVYDDHGTTEQEALPWKNPSTPAQVWLNTVEKLRLLCESLNEGTVLDFLEAGQAKYRPWVEFKKDLNEPAGFRVSGTLTAWTYTDTLVGSRLCVKSDALAKHILNHFMDDLLIYFNK